MRKLYIVTTPKKILGMADIVGPLTTPSEIKFTDVLQMVRLGYNIYQVNPYDHSEKIKVTITNINDIEFKNSISKALSQRKLNREIQEMDKPVVVDVVTKAPKQKEPEEEVVVKETVKEKKKQNNDQEKILKPDAFTK